MDIRKIVIIGGAGFVGQNLVKSLLAKCHSNVELLVLDTASFPASDIIDDQRCTCRKCNFADIEETRSFLQGFGADTIVLLASMGMSGSAMLNEQCKQVNVIGTERLLSVCKEMNIPNFIYTSSYNVAFGGNEIKGGDETWPYFPIDKHTDWYSSTKAMAEKTVLEANGMIMENGHRLKTSAIRPAAIYGVNEQRHLPRIVKHMDTGLFAFRIGRATVDWVEIENLIQAFLLMIDKLYECPAHDTAPVAPAGQAYFISDGTPVENFEFLRLLCLARGRKYPRLVLSTSFMLGVGRLFEWIHHASKALGVPIEPFLTRAEVLKVGVTHYFSIDKAKRDLGYLPSITSQQGAQRIALHYRQQLSNENYFEMPAWYWWTSIIVGMLLTGLVAYCAPEGPVLTSPILWPVNQLALLIFRNQFNLQVLFISAWAVHAGEAIYAVRLAQNQLGVKNTLLLWFLQTFLLGYPNIQLIKQRHSFMKKTANQRQQQQQQQQQW